MTVAMASGTRRVDGVAHAGPMARGAMGASLLPAPGLVTPVDVQEGALALEALQSRQGRNDMKDVELQVNRFRAASAEQTKKMMEAIRKMEEAEREKEHGFWASLKSIAGTVAKIAAVVAAGASIAVSGGAALPLIAGIAAVTLSGGGMLVRETRLFGDASDKVALGLEIGGAVCGLGGAAVALFAKGAAVASTAASVTKSIGGGAQIVNGVAMAGSSAATVALADLGRDAKRAETDAEEARGDIERNHQKEQQLIDWLEGMKESERQFVENTRGVLEAANEAANAAVAGVRA